MSRMVQFVMVPWRIGSAMAWRIGAIALGESFRRKLQTRCVLLCDVLWYCWWTKSCTTKDDDYPIIYRVLTIPGFCPSTVSSYANLVSCSDCQRIKSATASKIILAFYPPRWHVSAFADHLRCLFSFFILWTFFNTCQISDLQKYPKDTTSATVAVIKIRYRIMSRHEKIPTGFCQNE